MGRCERLDPEHGWHHVMNRGTRRWNIFLDDADRRRFVRLLGSTHASFGVQVVAYCLMGNHFHVVVHCPDGNLSRAMRDLTGRYARGFNARHGFSGPVVGGRFRSNVIVDDRQLLTTIRYVHRNPLELDPGMCLSLYPWSTHAAYLGLVRSHRWIRPETPMELLGNDVASYQAFVEAPLAHDEVQNSPAHHPPVTVPGTVTGQASEAAGWSLAEIAQAVARGAGASPGAVVAGDRAGLIGAALILAIDDAGYTPGEVAEPFGYRGSGAVRTAVHRARRMAHEARFADVLEAARDLLATRDMPSEP